MTEQLGFVFDPDKQTKFDQFHADNPHVYELLVRLGREWVRRFGRRKMAIAMLYEKARWEIAFSTNDAEFRINNDHRAYYSRLIMAQEPDLTGLFELRSSKADEWIAGVA